MVTRRYEGAWLQNAPAFYGEKERFTVSGPTDPAHGDRSDAKAPLMIDAPLAPDRGEIYSDALIPGLDNVPNPVRIDETPVEGHGTPAESGHGYGGIFVPGAAPPVTGIMRGKDDGAAKRATSQNPMYRFFNENFFGFFTRGSEPPPIADYVGNPVFVRGINSMDVNNGPGRPWSWSTDGTGTWRRGDYEGSNVQRDFTPPNRRHGELKMVEPDIVTIVGDATPPTQSDTYASPFSSLQKFLPTRRRVRGIRRDPGPWDEELQAITYPDRPTYGYADGLVVP